MHVQRFTFNPFQTNCYIYHDGAEAALIDPSCGRPDEYRIIDQYLEQEGLRLTKLLLTHAHIDHVFGCAHFAGRTDEGFLMHREDKPLLERAEDQARMFGVPIDPPPPAGGYLEEDDEVVFGEIRLRVLHTPGHSPGSICFYDEGARTVLSGDVLFQGSIGRTDLWRGSLPELMTSIFQKLLPLGDDVRVLPGHGPETTIGAERRTNPFLTRGFAPG